eukprot:TRINITY_DN2187_c0_g1_i1.p1 TRINITY_DN2187_c0_g1~~TRINITY_DN2187_c0_g1_i1.p1  ORF type:complete len:462 (+),score=50.20 TRINITY_DN2187_c0_g1_i1:193-1578(+)
MSHSFFTFVVCIIVQSWLGTNCRARDLVSLAILIEPTIPNFFIVARQDKLLCHHDSAFEWKIIKSVTQKGCARSCAQTSQCTGYTFGSVESRWICRLLAASPSSLAGQALPCQPRTIMRIKTAPQPSNQQPSKSVSTTRRSTIPVVLSEPPPRRLTANATLRQTLPVWNRNMVYSSVSSPLARLLTNRRDVAVVLQRATANDSLNRVVVTTVTKGFLDFFYNLAHSIRRAMGSLASLVVIAEDLDVYRALQAQLPGQVLLATPELLPSNVMQQVHDAAYAYYHTSYRFLMAQRPRYLLQLMSVINVTVLFTDADVVWISNPWKHWSRGYGIMAAPDGKHLSVALRPGRKQYCAGFVFFQANIAVLNFLGNWTATMDTLGSHTNQQSFNRLLFTAPFNITIAQRALPPTKFPSGAMYFSHEDTYFQTHQPVVVHNNFVVGAEVKRRRFKKARLWHPQPLREA